MTQTLHITCGEEDYSIQAAQYPDGICQFYLEHSYRQTQGVLTGTACGADGKVLYLLQENARIPA